MSKHDSTKVQHNLYITDLFATFEKDKKILRCELFAIFIAIIEIAI